MNVSPEKNIEGAKTDIICMSLEPVTNTLKKGQENGDATKVISSGEVAIVREDVPVIDSKTVNYNINLDGKRQLPNGEVMRTNVTEERRKLQKAIIKNQEQQIEIEQKETR